jgi:hypothetical protein
MKYIDKDAVVAEVERLDNYWHLSKSASGQAFVESLFSFLDTLGAKEVNWEKERMEECPYRQVGCTMYEGKILECRGACSWVVDNPKLKHRKGK